MVVDLAFDGKMTDPEVRSLCSQLMYSYGANKRAAQPCLLYLTSLTVRGNTTRRSCCWQHASCGLPLAFASCKASSSAVSRPWKSCCER